MIRHCRIPIGQEISRAGTVLSSLALFIRLDLIPHPKLCGQKFAKANDRLAGCHAENFD